MIFYHTLAPSQSEGYNVYKQSETVVNKIIMTHNRLIVKMRLDRTSITEYNEKTT